MTLVPLFILLSLLIIIVFDVWAWRQDEVPTISQVTRTFMRDHGIGAVGVLLALGMLLGHLFWCGA